MNIIKKIFKFLYLEQWVIVSIVFIILYSCANWGLPTKERISALLGNGTVQLSELQLQLLDKTNRKKVKIAKKKYLSKSSDFQRVPDNTPGLFSKMDMLYAFQDFIVYSSAVDEMKTYNALRKIKPKQLQFDPQEFRYGGVYLYFVGFLLFLAKLSGIIVTSHNLNFYLNHPEYISKMIIIGRIPGIISYMGILFLLARFGRLLKNRATGSLAMIMFLGSSVCFNQSLVSKPHIFATFLALLAVYLLFIGKTNKSHTYMNMGVVTCGLAMGTSIILAISATFIISFVFDMNNLLISSKRIIKYGLLMIAVFFMSNPYVLINHEAFLATFTNHASGSYDYGVIKFYKLLLFWNKLIISFSPLTTVIGLFSAIFIAIKSKKNLARLAIGFMLVLFTTGLFIPVPRLYSYIGPFLALFAAIGLISLYDTVRFLPRILKHTLIGLSITSSLIFFFLISYEMIFDNTWLKSTKEFIEQTNFTKNILIGFSHRPHPIKMQPLPFLNVQAVDLKKYHNTHILPDYIVVYDNWRAWKDHPLRNKYKLFTSLNDNTSYKILNKWRVRSLSTYPRSSVYIRI